MRFRIFFSQNIFVSRRVGGSPRNGGCVPHSRRPGSLNKVACLEKGSAYAHDSEVVECNRGSRVCDCSDALAWSVVAVAVETFLE